MTTTLDKQIDRWMAGNQDGMVQAAMDLIEVRSVCQAAPGEAHPFGEGCAQVLERMLDMAARLGFETRNYGYYAGTATLPGQGPGRIGIMVHLDTAPESDTWTIGPFSPYVKEGRLYGRGSSDNKGAAAASLYVLKCLRDLGLSLNCSIELFFGCAKKSYMEDAAYYLEHTPPPDFTFVADANFPVCIGEKGSLDGILQCDLSASNLVDFRGGRTYNAVPDQVFALLAGFSADEVRAKLENPDNFSIIPVGDLVKVSTTGVGGHAAFPETTKNPLPTLARALIRQGLVTGSAVPALGFLADVFQGCHGAQLGLEETHPVFGTTTHAGGRVYMEDGRLMKALNVRYVPGLTADEVQARIEAQAGPHGFSFRRVSNTPPHRLAQEVQPIADMLGTLCNQVLGTQLSPYTMGGVTYAGCLPRAVAFGPNRSDLAQSLVEGIGGGHSVDEYIRIQSLVDFLKIYVRGLCEVDRLLATP